MNIEKEIQNYITAKENNGAILITGKWGCGKTYLLKTIVEKYNKDDKYLLSLVSLFGIESIDNFHRSIKETVFFSRGFEGNSNIIKDNFKKFKQATKPLFDAFGEMSKIVKGVGTAINLNWQDFFTVNDEVECVHNGELIKKKLVLILDDFERSKVDLIALMGAINDYCENKNIKVIVVADEDHINGNEYKDFKEKLISRTIRIVPEHKDIVRSIIFNYNETESGYCNFLKRNMGLILQLFSESNTENLRSLKSLFLDFERVFGLWKTTNIPTDVLPKVFYNYGAILFTVKSGEYKEGPYGDLFADDKIRKAYNNWDGAHKLSSLKRWAINGIWDEKDFVDEVRQKYGAVKMSAEERFLHIHFWGLDQETITKGMPVVLKKAYEGQLSRNGLIDLFQKIYAMKEYGVDFPCEVDFDKIYAGFEIRRSKILSSEIVEPQLRRSAFREHIPEECKVLYESITKFDDYLTAFNNKKVVFNYLQLDSKISEYSLNGLIVGYFDKQLLEQVWVAFTNADNSKKRDIIRVVKNLGFKDQFYSTYSDMQKSVENFNDFKTRLENYKTIISDGMTVAIINESIREIDNLIAEITEVIQLLSEKTIKDN